MRVNFDDEKKECIKKRATKEKEKCHNLDDNEKKKHLKKEDNKRKKEKRDNLDDNEKE